MLTLALLFILIIFYFLAEQEDIKCCLLMWSAIFLMDFIIPSPPEVYFQVALTIDCLLLVSCMVIRDRWKMLLCMSVLALSAMLNLREGFSYYQTSTYVFLTYYQWVSIEIILAILLFKVRLKHDIFKISRTHH